MLVNTSRPFCKTSFSLVIPLASDREYCQTGHIELLVREDAELVVRDIQSVEIWDVSCMEVSWEVIETVIREVKRCKINRIIVAE